MTRRNTKENFVLQELRRHRTCDAKNLERFFEGSNKVMKVRQVVHRLRLRGHEIDFVGGYYILRYDIQQVAGTPDPMSVPTKRFRRKTRPETKASPVKESLAPWKQREIRGAEARKRREEAEKKIEDQLKKRGAVDIEVNVPDMFPEEVTLTRDEIAEVVSALRELWGQDPKYHELCWKMVGKQRGYAK